ncbi:MAG TPA: alpha/beta fold hydrolase [Pseudonocardia sp.]|nr:alpha/beta fold hydrolase [Pseudonocardia sp.]
MATSTHSRSHKKTIVRSFWHVVDRAAPGIGARHATRLWFTVPRPGPVEPVPGGRAFTVTVDGRRVAGRTWGDDTGPAVLLVHGWGGRGDQFGALVAPLVAAGHRVLAFDAPGHGGSAPGRWGPRQATIPEFTAAIEAVVAEHGRPHAVVAHSLGAAAVGLALRGGLRPDALVLVSPLADAWRYLDGFAAVVGFGPRVRARVERRIVARVGLPWGAFDLRTVPRSAPVPPLLVVHDRRDREVAFRDGEEIAAAWPAAELIPTAGLGHRRILREPGVVDAIAGFVTASRPGSGAQRFPQTLERAS